MRALPFLRADPGLFSLKRAARAAIVMPCVFAFADKVVQDQQVATFSAFGSFAILVLADFGGPRRVRLASYLALAAAGAVLIVVGTLCSRDPWIAAAAMAVVGFGVLFSGVINGYFAAAGTAAMLTFVLPVNIPASPSVIPARLEGWALAASVGICAVMLLWPAQPRDKLRAGIAGACTALAELLESELSGESPELAERARDARAAVAAVREEFLATPFRPTGPTGATEALAFLVDELDWFRSFVVPPGEQQVPLPDLCRDENREVLAAVAGVLRASAAELEGGDERPDLERLDRARDAVAAALTRRIAELPRVHDDLELLAMLEPSFRMRALSYSARQIGANSLSAAEGGGLRPSSALHATERLAAEHASPRSVWFRNSVRGAAALAVSVFVAQEAGLQHAFWVVLGTLSVLRSNALATGATILSALGGTAVGIVAGAGIILAIGSDEPVAWAALPVGVLLAAYAPRVISFAAGQAGFTIVVLMLFNLIQPSGWKVGIVRVEDVAIGFAVSLAVGVLFWPRGAAALMRESLAAAYARAADYVVATLRGLPAPADPARREQAGRAAEAAARRLDDAFRQYLAERSVRRMSMESVATLVAGATRVQRTALSLRALSRMTDGAALGEGCAAALDPEIEAFHRWYSELGRALGDGRAPPPPHERDADGRRRVLDCARRAVAEGDEGTIRPALGLLWASQHLDNLRRLEDHLVEPAEEAAS